MNDRFRWLGSAGPAQQAFLGRCDAALDRTLQVRRLRLDSSCWRPLSLGAREAADLQVKHLLSLTRNTRPDETSEWQGFDELAVAGEPWLDSAARLVVTLACARNLEALSAAPGSGLLKRHLVSGSGSRVARFSEPEAAVAALAAEIEHRGLSGRQVLVKPNIVSWEPPPTTSDPVLLALLCDRLSALGCTARFADSPSLFHDGPTVLEAFAARLKETVGFMQPVDLLDDEPVVDMAAPGAAALFLSRSMVEAEWVLNVATLKGHLEVGHTGARKNVFAALTDFQRLRAHLDRALTPAISATAGAVAPTLHLLDARQILVGAQQVMRGGLPRPGPGIYLGVNAEAVDRAALDAAGSLCSSPPVGERT